MFFDDHVAFCAGILTWSVISQVLFWLPWIKPYIPNFKSQLAICLLGKCIDMFIRVSSHTKSVSVDKITICSSGSVAEECFCEQNNYMFIRVSSHTKSFCVQNSICSSGSLAIQGVSMDKISMMFIGVNSHTKSVSMDKISGCSSGSIAVQKVFVDKISIYSLGSIAIQREFLWTK